jgi:hypothetical protein
VAVIALVVVATTLFLGLITSLRRTLVSTGDARNMIVMRKGSTNDGASQLSLQALQDIRFFDGIARNASDEPLLSPELVVQPFFWRKDGGRENVLVRGVDPPIALAVHEDVKLVSGRMFEPSSGEAVVGSGVAGRYRGAQLGEELEFGRGHWKVVGVFDSGGCPSRARSGSTRGSWRTTPSAPCPTRASGCAWTTGPTRMPWCGASATTRATPSRRSPRPTTTRSRRSPRTRSTCW